MKRLAEILSQDDAVLFIGSGLSCWAGLPTWPRLIEELAQFVESSGSPADLIRAEAARGDLLQAASYGFDKLTRSQIGEFIRKACRYGQARPHEIHRKIVTLGPRCFITTNYDDLLEQSLRLWRSQHFFRPPVTNRQLTETAVRAHCDQVAASSAICDGRCTDIAQSNRCGSCDASCTYGNCGSPGTCTWEEGAGDGDSCNSICARNNGSCSGARYTSFLTDLPMTPACSFVRGSPLPVQVTLSEINCWCHNNATNMNVMVARPNGFATCEAFCTSRGDVCWSTPIHGVTAAGLPVACADVCQPPYDLMPSWDGVTVGQTVWLDDYEILMTCDCTAPAQ